MTTCPFSVGNDPFSCRCSRSLSFSFQRPRHHVCSLSSPSGRDRAGKVLPDTEAPISFQRQGECLEVEGFGSRAERRVGTLAPAHESLERGAAQAGCFGSAHGATREKGKWRAGSCRCRKWRVGWTGGWTHSKWMCTRFSGRTPPKTSKRAFVPSSFQERSLPSGPTYAAGSGGAGDGQCQLS